MSLELSGTNPLVVAKSGIPSKNDINLYSKDSDIDIPMEDFCDLVEYTLTNTDLFPDDPRLKLIAKLKNADVTEGYNTGGSRITF